ncbi:fungal-specific transcription factor domain-containing protein [Aspergillus cavernicola]|uniref:Fungal-specific transcription factor domain-containing protein n=1 Tax=Aspergillus cavernicola TaxID=176166 RepID=A0ABR4IGD5_9EURO
MEKTKSTICRTRSGCWNCKKRRRRCSEDKPSCSGCVKRGLECIYGMRLLWEDEAESMGIAFGRAGMKNRFGQKKTRGSHYLLPVRSYAPRYWISTTSDDIRCLYEGSPDGEVVAETDYGEDVAMIPFALSHCPSLAEIDLSDTCTIRRSLVDYENPWRSVLLPLCYQSEGLLHIAIAWAAHTLRNQCEGRDVSRYDQTILVHKCRSLKHLRNMIPQHPSDNAICLARTRGERDAVLLLVMFHCLLEIASGSIMEWTYHMKGALLIMKFYTNLRGTAPQDVFSQEVLELVYAFFIEKDTFLGTTIRNKEDLQWSTEVPSMFPFLTSRGSMKVNPCMGLSPELLDIISSISKLAESRHPAHPAHHSQTLTPEFTTLQHRLHSLQRQRLPRRDDGAGLMALHHTAFKEATWIYLHHALGAQPRHSDIIQRIHLPQLLQALEQIHKIHGSLLGFIPYPMWALFVASCVVLEDDRVKILEWFTVLKCNKPISNVPSTMAAVEAIWKRRDLDLDLDLETSQVDREGSVKWEPVWAAAISRLGWKMPFT